MYDEQREPVISVELFLVIDDQCSYHTGDPAAEGEEEDDQERAAALVDHRQGRKEDAQQNAEKTHWNLRISNTKIENFNTLLQFLIVYDDLSVGVLPVTIPDRLRRSVGGCSACYNS